MLVSTTCSESFDMLSKLLICVVRDFRLSVLVRPLASRSSWRWWIPRQQQENAALNSSRNFPGKPRSMEGKRIPCKYVPTNHDEGTTELLPWAKLTMRCNILQRRGNQEKESVVWGAWETLETIRYFHKIIRLLFMYDICTLFHSFRGKLYTFASGGYF